MKLDLPAITTDAAPGFTDAKTCLQWLSDLPLANVGPSHGRLLGELEELNGFALPPGERIRILELLREAILFVQSEQARKYIGKPVPLAKQEREIFQNVVALWNALATGWRRCLKDLADNVGGVSGQADLICQRALWSAGLKLAEHYGVYQEFSAGEWQTLNRVYAFAMAAGVADKGVSNPTAPSAPAMSCSETFAQIQLLALANPNEHAPRLQSVISRWIGRWGSKVTISSELPGSAGATPITVDLETGECATRRARTGNSIVCLDTSEIGKSLKKRVAALKQGESPELLGLGKDLSEGLAAELLVTLQQRWCEDIVARQSGRRTPSGDAWVCVGMAAMHYFITGLPFEAQPGNTTLTAQQREHFETFGQLSTRTNDDYTVTHGFALEQWRVLDESLLGFRLERPRDRGASRFLHHQLIAVRPADAPSFYLCSVRWISLSGDQVPRLGTRTMPGMARGIGARLGGLNVHSEKFVPALFLPAVAALRSPPTLVLPAGWFRPKRLVEIQGGAVEGRPSGQVLLSGVLERGSDFERCTFEKA